MSFPQTKFVKLADLSLTVAPIIAFVTAWLQLSYIGIESINTAVAMAILILSLPIHGYYLLGKQADSVLPIGLKSWYKEIEQQLKQDNFQVKQFANLNKSNSQKLTYMDLAKLLKVRFERN